MSSSSLSQRTRPKRSIWQQIWIKRWCYLIILPGMAYFLLFKYVPMYGIQLAFKEFNIAEGISASPWVGWANFELLFRDREFFLALKNTLIISYMQLLLFFPFPIVLSILINEVKPMRYKRSVQTILTFPHFLSWVIVAGIMMNILANNGAVNNLLATMGLEKYNFLTDKGLFRYILVFTLSWKEAGWSCILYIAAITGIDPSLYESADIDGAGRFSKIWNITLPSITPTIKILLVLSIGRLLSVGFEQVYLLKSASTTETASTLEVYIYDFYMKYGMWAQGSAMSIFNSLVSVVLIVGCNLLAKRLDGEGIM